MGTQDTAALGPVAILDIQESVDTLGTAVSAGIQAIRGQESQATQVFLDILVFLVTVATLA